MPQFEELAEKMGATLSVSRPLVDAGWVSNARQVGQSGKTVKPKVYLALGISGAVQHLAGMQNADTIIAVNTDPEAPIFRVAHYGAVADLFDVADELAEQFRRLGRWASSPSARGREDPRGLLGLRAGARGALVRARGLLGARVRLRRGAADRQVQARSRRRLAAALRAARAASARRSRILLSHVSIRRRDPYVGWAHRGIFYGFVVLFIGTVILAINTDFTEPVFGWRFFKGDFYLGYSLVLDVLGLALLAGVADDDGAARH